jgi:hypothetical protein
MASGKIEGARFERFKPSGDEAVFRPVRINNPDGLNFHLRVEAAPGHDTLQRIGGRKNLKNKNRRVREWIIVRVSAQSRKRRIPWRQPHRSRSVSIFKLRITRTVNMLMENCRSETRATRITRAYWRSWPYGLELMKTSGRSL